MYEWVLQGWQAILTAGIVPLLDLSGCESRVGHDHLQDQLIPDSNQPLHDVTACLLHAGLDYERSATSLLGKPNAEGSTRFEQHDFPRENPRDLIETSIKPLATTTCFSEYLSQVFGCDMRCSSPLASRTHCHLVQSFQQCHTANWLTIGERYAGTNAIGIWHMLKD
eukprot:COSAG02_NODE_6846_length_3329_cov_6.995356_4_plen_167_part_00